MGNEISEFEDLCDNVRKNDASTRTVSTTCLTEFRDEHAVQLAQALLDSVNSNSAKKNGVVNDNNGSSSNSNSSTTRKGGGDGNSGGSAGDSGGGGGGGSGSTGSSTRTTATATASYSRVEKMDIHVTHLTYKGAHVLGKALQRLPSLRSVQVCSTFEYSIDINNINIEEEEPSVTVEEEYDDDDDTIVEEQPPLIAFRRNTGRGRGRSSRTTTNSSSSSSGRGGRRGSRAISGSSSSNNRHQQRQKQQQQLEQQQRQQQQQHIQRLYQNQRQRHLQYQHSLAVRAIIDELCQCTRVRIINFVGLDFTNSVPAFTKLMSSLSNLKSFGLVSPVLLQQQQADTCTHHDLTTTTTTTDDATTATLLRDDFAKALILNTSLEFINFHGLSNQLLQAAIPVLEHHVTLKWLKIDFDSTTNLPYNNHSNNLYDASTTLAIQKFVENNVTKVENFMWSRSSTAVISPPPSSSSTTACTATAATAASSSSSMMLIPILKSLQQNTTIKNFLIVDSVFEDDIDNDIDGTSNSRRGRHRRRPNTTNNNNNTNHLIAIGLKNLFRNNTTIEKFSITGCHLSNTQFAQLAQGLYRNMSVRELDVSENCMRGMEAGQTLRAIIQRNKHLTKMDVSKNHFGGSPHGTRLIASALEQVATNAAAAASADPRSTTSNSSQLVELEMNQLRILDEDVSILSYAMMNSVSVSTTSTSHNHSNNNNNNIDNSSAPTPTITLSPIKLLSFAGNYVGPNGIMDLIHALPYSHIETLSLSGNHYLGLRGIRLLAQHLVRGYPDGVSILGNPGDGDDDVDSTGYVPIDPTNYPAVADVEEPDGGVGTIGVTGHSHCRLKVLILDRTDMTDAALDALSMALQHNTSIEFISMDDNQFSYRGLMVLFQRMSRFGPKLRRLDFEWSYNPSILGRFTLIRGNGGAFGGVTGGVGQGDTPSAEDLEKALITGLKSNTSLTNINICGNYDLSEELKTFIAYYTERNRYRPLVHADDEMEAAPPALWPYALARLACGSGGGNNTTGNNVNDLRSHGTNNHANPPVAAADYSTGVINSIGCTSLLYTLLRTKHMFLLSNQQQQQQVAIVEDHHHHHQQQQEHGKKKASRKRKRTK